MEYKLTHKAYFESLKENKLLGLKCAACGNVTCPPKMTCQECAGTNLEIVQLTGNGKIATLTTSYVAPLGREDEAPYTIALVELDEGPWIMGNLTGIDPTKVGMELIGQKVKLGNKVFAGDMYSSGEGVRPLFSIAG